MLESTNAQIRNRIVSALAELRFGEIGKAKKHLKGALMILDDDLETMFCNGVNVCPGDGAYKVLIDDLHILTKRIKDGHGSNHLPWLTKIPLLPWKSIIAKYGLPTGDFEVIPAKNERCCLLEYKDGRIIDKVVQVRGLPNTWCGSFWYENELKFWFKMVQI